ncbi:LysR family transcriptional regulator [Acinetobacter dispersus]|uniref:LysR family transcriptional regulator n=1 Tax=Acinetobacter dispersus TaxID=70348 RepID=UPI001F4A26F4|nr:LysR family transcriptional regulator [Acinetobacter dispersus]MCH7393543.1 LysR family transcriptional regulator [Acinetobacter dispersus]
MDKLRLIEIFVTVADTHSFTRAAERLGVTRPAISKAIADLEAHLQAKLWHRTTRKISLTNEGEFYLQSCLEILERLDTVETEIANKELQPKGRLRVDVSPSIAKSIILPHINQFFEKYSYIQLMLGVSDTNVDLVESAVDCVIRIGEVNNPNVVAKYLGEISFTCCASPEYLDIHGIPQVIEDLYKHNAINYFTANSGRTLPWTFYKDGKNYEVRMDSVLAVNDAEICLSQALQGNGLAILANFLANPYLKTGELVNVMSDYTTIVLPISIVYSPIQSHNQKLRVFVDWIADLWCMLSKKLTDQSPS